jgi:carboxyl-terminal processing protease
MRLVLGAGFAAILERHLEAASPTDLLVWALAALSRHDPRFAVLRRGREVQLRLANVPILTRSLADARGMTPARAGGAAGDLLTLFHEAAWAVSPPLRSLGAPQLIGESFEAIFGHLDPFSRYISPAEAQAARERRTGEAGLGLRLAPGRGTGATVAAVMDGGPAAEAGLRVGDRVLAIDGVPLRTRDAGVIQGLLEGPAGTEVVLLVQRGRERFERRLIRRLPVGAPVEARRIENVLLLRIPGFSGRTEAEVEAALQAEMVRDPPQAVLIDLRGNRGGVLHQAAAVADIFLGEGEAFRTVGRHPESRRIYATEGRDQAEGLPIVVLVDGRTASSAELLAASLSDRGRAAVAGTGTMGKGLVQLVVPLPDGGELLLSWSRLILPTGWPLQGVGVLPGLCTAQGPEAAAAALAALRAGARPMGPAQARQRALRRVPDPAEAEALRSTCPAGEAREDDIALARALALDPVAWRAALPR